MIWRSIIVWNKLSATISNGRSITVSERVVRMMVLEGGDEGRDTGEAEGADEGALCGGAHLEADGGGGGGAGGPPLWICWRGGWGAGLRRAARKRRMATRAFLKTSSVMP